MKTAKRREKGSPTGGKKKQFMAQKKEKPNNLMSGQEFTNAEVHPPEVATRRGKNFRGKGK